MSGPVNLPDPPGVTIMHVETARDMLQAVERALPVDVAIFAAAVADWRVASRPAEDQEEGRPGHAATLARGKSRHPLDHRPSQIAAPEAW